jgi:hypothetical protein
MTCVFPGKHGTNFELLWEQEIVGSNPTDPDYGAIGAGQRPIVDRLGCRQAKLRGDTLACGAAQRLVTP